MKIFCRGARSKDLASVDKGSTVHYRLSTSYFFENLGAHQYVIDSRMTKY